MGQSINEGRLVESGAKSNQGSLKSNKIEFNVKWMLVNGGQGMIKLAPDIYQYCWCLINKIKYTLIRVMLTFLPLIRH